MFKLGMQSGPCLCRLINLLVQNVLKKLASSKNLFKFEYKKFRGWPEDGKYAGSCLHHQLKLRLR